MSSLDEITAAVPPAKKPRPTKAVVLSQVLEGIGVHMSFNEFTGTQVIKLPGQDPRPLTDADETRIRNEMFSRDASVYPGVVTDRLYQMAMENRFHPVRHYLDSVQWDGVARIDEWLTTFMGAESSPYSRKIGAAVLIAACRRIRNPGCKFDEALVLVGNEGSGKSSGIKALCPDPDWFTDSLAINSGPKQVVEGTTGIWIVESAEMVGAKHIDQVKAFLSRQVDGPVRLAYARHPVSRPRQFIVIGTTNEWRPLANETGARRFWPLHAGCTNVGGLERMRDQLWAEASVREMAGETTFIDVELIATVEAAQNEFSTPHPWLEIIDDRLKELPNRAQVPIGDIWEWVGVEKSRQTRELSSQIQMIMRKLGFDKREQAEWVPSLGKMARVYAPRNPFLPENADTRIASAPPEEPDYDLPDDEVEPEDFDLMEGQVDEEAELIQAEEEMLRQMEEYEEARQRAEDEAEAPEDPED